MRQEPAVLPVKLLKVNLWPHEQSSKNFYNNKDTFAPLTGHREGEPRLEGLCTLL